MVRKWGWGMLCILVLFYLVHGLLLWRFFRQEPRVEVYLEGELSQAAALLDTYEPRQEEGCLVIQGKELSPFTKNEVEDRLAAGGLDGFAINDRSQAWRLALQSLTLSFFLLALGLFSLGCVYLVKDIQRLVSAFRRWLEEEYFLEVVKREGEKLLIGLIRWVVLGFSLAFLGIWMGKVSFFLPFEWLPPRWIWDVSHYLSLESLHVGQSGYELLCRKWLPVFYCFTLGEGFCVLGLGIGLGLRRKKGKKVA